jgi:phage FluMu gp28-like protein
MSDQLPPVAVTDRLSPEEWTARRTTMGRVTSADWTSGAILLRYQQRMIEATDVNDVTVVEKSRRTGATWGAAADSVLRSGSPRGKGGMDTLYVGTSYDMAKEFIDAVAMWARTFGKGCSEIRDALFDDGSEDGIKALRIDFASGFSVVALSSRPRSMRGRQGFAILDEAAFADDLKELLKAAMAFLIWGGKVLVISTHNGAANPFNQLVTDIREGRSSYALVRFTFDDALDDGLYERICMLNPERHGDWSPAKEAGWRESIVKSYGEGADEELYCIPAQGSGVWLSDALIEQAMVLPPDRILRLALPREFTYRPELERRSWVDAWIADHLLPVLSTLDPLRRSALGMDVARYVDLSVLTPVQELLTLTKRVPFIVELSGVPFQQQFQIWCAIFDRLPRRAGGKIDATGIGAQLAETAAQKYSPAAVEEVKFSAEWWRVTLPPVKALFEDRAIELPRDADIKGDLRAVKIIHGIAQLPALRQKSTTGGRRHGDFAPSLALAIDALKMTGGDFGYQSARQGHENDDEDASGDRRDPLW